MDFKEILIVAGINIERTALALHRPSRPSERTALQGYLETDRELFDAYQATHPKNQEATLKKRDFMGSFVTKSNGELVFCGLYSQAGWRDLSAAELDAMPVYVRLHERRDWSFSKEAKEKGVPGRALFTLNLLPELRPLIGRLVVADPGGRNHMRKAENTDLRVVEITREMDFAPPMPKWNELILSAEEIRALPRGWAEHLAAWRGIYLIVDETDGARYVGSAYGNENLLGRWRAHCSGEFGVTKELAKRKTSGFRFSILELLSPSAGIEDVTRVEQGWMDRLHTRTYGLNA